MSARLGGPCLASQDTSKNPPSPSGEPGLVMPRPCHTDRSFREGEKLRKKAQVLKKAHNTFFCLYQMYKLVGALREDTDLDPWRQRP